MPSQREAITQQACDHTHEVWILGQVRPSHYAIADMQLIRGNHASLVAVLHPSSTLPRVGLMLNGMDSDGDPPTKLPGFDIFHDMINLAALVSARQRQQEVMRTFP